jgi:hypothetical protein
LCRCWWVCLSGRCVPGVAKPYHNCRDEQDEGPRTADECAAPFVKLVNSSYNVCRYCTNARTSASVTSQSGMGALSLSPSGSMPSLST